MNPGPIEADVVSNVREIVGVNRLVVKPCVPEGLVSAWRFPDAPGQVARVSAAAGTEGVFAIASPPGAEALVFLVKAGGTSSEPLMELAPGARVQVEGPFGAGFVLPEPSIRYDRCVFAAAGTAVAAAFAGASAALARGIAADQIAIVLAVRTTRELCLRDELAALRALGVHVRIVVSRPATDAVSEVPDVLWDGLTGRVQNHLEGIVGPASWVFLAGSDAFEDAVQAAAFDLGVDETHVQKNYRPDRRRAR